MLRAACEGEKKPYEHVQDRELIRHRSPGARDPSTQSEWLCYRFDFSLLSLHHHHHYHLNRRD
jgi:hypothetical protein